MIRVVVADDEPLITAGIRAVLESAGDIGVVAQAADAAQALLAMELQPGDVVLLKSSRDAGLRWLGDRLAGATEETT